jgi:hypothetical protein
MPNRQRPNKTPARSRYWGTNRLERNKIRNMVRHCNMTETKARREWINKRKTRMKTGV